MMISDETIPEVITEWLKKRKLSLHVLSPYTINNSTFITLMSLIFLFYIFNWKIFCGKNIHCENNHDCHGGRRGNFLFMKLSWIGQWNGAINWFIMLSSLQVELAEGCRLPVLLRNGEGWRKYWIKYWIDHSYSFPVQQCRNLFTNKCLN